MKRVVCSVVLGAAVAAGAAEPAPVTFEPHVFTNRANPSEVLPYRLAKPADWSPTNRYPLLVFLHGAGERGTDNQRQVSLGRSWMEQAVAQHHAIVVAPQCPPDARWVEVDWILPAHAMPAEPSRPMRLLLDLLPAIEKDCGVDPARRYVAGLSMGGYGTWDALCRRPDYFAAGVPICGGGDEKQAAAIAAIPLWAFHGEVDNVVPVARSRNMIEALKKAGGAPKYTEFPGVNHFSWNKAFRDPQLLAWLFEQKRSDSGAAAK